MDKKLKLLFTPEVLREAAGRFGIRPDSLRDLNGFQNFVYAGMAGDREIILRLAPQAHRDEAAVRAELEFVAYLSEAGLPVPRPIPSVTGEEVHLVQDGFVVTAFEKVPGRHVRIAEESNLFYENLGRLVGRVHQLSRRYSPRQPRRYEWHENAFLTTFTTYCPSPLHDPLDRILKGVSRLPQEHDGYGLIHGDVSSGNYLNDGGSSYLIDFDQAEYSWYVSDIATPLFYEIPIPWVVGDELRKEITKRFFVNYLNGYSAVNAVPDSWLKLIPLFLELKQAIVLSALYRSRDFQASDWSEWDEQARRFFYNNMLNNTPYIDLDFARL
ncbi:phosphotransferase enzyme family protein [Paenibacillus aurantiacus]|uniref:Phosphotransferase enzyme family protein n=1 Tax=Paenibacillus aurantiacus TaxID=1936118 RepID=A0ABV5KHW9_9BACL